MPVELGQRLVIGPVQAAADVPLLDGDGHRFLQAQRPRRPGGIVDRGRLDAGLHHRRNDRIVRVGLQGRRDIGALGFFPVGRFEEELILAPRQAQPGERDQPADEPSFPANLPHCAAPILFAVRPFPRRPTPQSVLSFIGMRRTRIEGIFRLCRARTWQPWESGWIGSSGRVRLGRTTNVATSLQLVDKFNRVPSTNQIVQ